MKVYPRFFSSILYQRTADMLGVNKLLVIKKSIVFFLLVGFSLSSVFAIQAQSSAEKSLKVMTFNIRYNEPRDGANAWMNRKTKVAGVIRFHKADLIGVQEAQNNQLKDLETLLPDFAWCGVGRDGGDKGEYSAILYRKERFKLLETKTFWLSETPEKAGSKGWDADYPRIVTWAKFQDRRTKKNFFLFNTHFDHRGERARMESAKMLTSRIEKIAGNLPFVVTGDFNARESTDVYKILTGKAENGNANLKDARYASINEHFGPTSTFNEFKELIPEMKIDYIFVRPGVKILEHGVLADRWDGLWASDHLPVLAEVLFR